VGANQADDGGAAPANDDMFGVPETGDLQLSAYFARMDEVNQQLNADDAASASDHATDADDK
jgi:hypothetical protein